MGVVKVLDLTIEILPKADNQRLNLDDFEATKQQETKWQSILIDMLKVCHLINTPSISDAHLKTRSNSILDLYIERFINEINALIRQGLIKKYRKVEDNCHALKGKLLVGKHVQKNLVHQERFYVAQSHYDKNHLLHKILAKAIAILPGLCNSQALISECCSLKLNFPEVDDLRVTENLFDKISFDRKSNPYQISIQIAKMLLLNYRPDLSTGANNSIAILFNMNQLWEEYIFKILHKSRPQSVKNIYNQKSIRFWETAASKRYLKPDIVIETAEQGNIVIDTKWKNINNDPSKIGMDDLRQMYAYHHFFEARKCYLLYPGNNEPIKNGEFCRKYFFKAEEIQEKHCGLIISKAWYESNLIAKTYLNSGLGVELYKSLGLI
ncbi:McrC family protein [Mucilaginibacter antarcticus]|uniref:McrC family protein n=1 Tax=Mucilaginibacter antarcticus TaxID=1855725 RepID=UPI00364333CD